MVPGLVLCHCLKSRVSENIFQDLFRVRDCVQSVLTCSCEMFLCRKVLMQHYFKTKECKQRITPSCNLLRITQCVQTSERLEENIAAQSPIHQPHMHMFPFCQHIPRAYSLLLWSFFVICQLDSERDFYLFSSFVLYWWKKEKKVTP